MFFHRKGLQFEAKPDRADPVYAKQLQELLGGAYGEITVSMQYLMQGWNARMPGKYKDLLLDIGTEELAHIEMLATMIGKLLEEAPIAQEAAAASDPAMGAIIGGMNPQHAIIAGLGPLPADSTGYPWNGRYVVASGNLMADFRANVTAESHGRLQAARLYGMTDDRGVKDMLSFLIARDTMHQNQWIAAMRELQEEGLEGTPVPSDFPPSDQVEDVAYRHFNLSADGQSAQGTWAQGAAPDGRGEFGYEESPQPATGEPLPPKSVPELFNTGRGGATQRAVDAVRDRM